MDFYLKLSGATIVSYAISWGFFFLTLPLFIRFFGKVKGSMIDYGISWILMLGIIYFWSKPSLT
jgi:hypothetical protein